jgi:protein-disulfide isomerase
MIDREVQVTSDVNAQFPDFYGTPTFVINGTMQPREIASWDKLEPLLQEALK